MDTKVAIGLGIEAIIMVIAVVSILVNNSKYRGKMETIMENQAKEIKRINDDFKCHEEENKHDFHENINQLMIVNSKLDRIIGGLEAKGFLKG